MGCRWCKGLCVWASQLPPSYIRFTDLGHWSADRERGRGGGIMLLHHLGSRQIEIETDRLQRLLYTAWFCYIT